MEDKETSTRDPREGKADLLKHTDLPPCTSRSHIATSCLLPAGVRLYGTRQMTLRSNDTRSGHAQKQVS